MRLELIKAEASNLFIYKVSQNLLNCLFFSMWGDFFHLIFAGGNKYKAYDAKLISSDKMSIY